MATNVILYYRSIGFNTIKCFVYSCLWVRVKVHAFEFETFSDETGYTKGTIKNDHDNIYDVSRDVFYAFAKNEMALLEMSLKKANLEDIFLELTEEKDAAVQIAAEQPETVEPEQQDDLKEIEVGEG